MPLNLNDSSKPQSLPLELSIKTVAQLLLGNPNPQLSSGENWRFGKKGSMSIDVEKNCWFDHEVNIGGGIIDLIMREHNCCRTEAIQWLSQLNSSDSSSATHHQLNNIKTIYTYKSASGQPVLQIHREDLPDGGKKITQCTWSDEKGTWVWARMALNCRPTGYLSYLRPPKTNRSISWKEKSVQTLLFRKAL